VSRLLVSGCFTSSIIPPATTRYVHSVCLQLELRGNCDKLTYPLSNWTFAAPLFANGTKIQNGWYRILLRALRVTGDPAEEKDYEKFVSPIIGIFAA
jgi:hypothetical protein